jgi:Protein of unknown function (DUF2924)
MTDRRDKPAGNGRERAKGADLPHIAQLQELTPAQLRERYQELFGVEHRSRCKQQLVRRISWKIQALSHGDLSERARRRILEISQDPELRIHLPARLVPIRRSTTVAARPLRQSPRRASQQPGCELRREYRGKTVVVKVLVSGYEYEGQQYGSLSAVARAATGTRWNGLVFFGVKKRNEASQELKRAAS